MIYEHLRPHPVSPALALSPSLLLGLLLLLVGEPSKAARQGEEEGEDEEEDEQYHRDVVHRPDQGGCDGEDDQRGRRSNSSLLTRGTIQVPSADSGNKPHLR